MAYSPRILYPLLFITTYLMLLSLVKAQLRVGFYDRICPQAEDIVRDAVLNAVSQNPGFAAGLVRMHFHDCFVRGCDASILLDGSGSEKNADPNGGLRGFEVIDAAKSQIEAICGPRKVSCADILSFAARDSVVLTGGPSWQVPTGRRDGTVSLMAEPPTFLPPPTANVDQLTRIFAVKRLSRDEMVTLSGAHTIGIAHCSTFTNRLYNFSTTASVDPTLNDRLAQRLQKQCPRGDPKPNTVVPLDLVSPVTFDNMYYADLQNYNGLLTSDQILYTDERTQKSVSKNAVDEVGWKAKFSKAMRRMSLIEVKTGSEGEIRSNCRAVNGNSR